MGHEFVGTVVEAGAEVKDIKIGDKVVAPFTSSWYVWIVPPSASFILPMGLTRN